MLPRQGLALLRDGAQQLGVVQRGLDLPAQHDRPVEVLLGVMALAFVPEIQGADHAVPDVQRHDHRRDALPFLQQDALGARQRVHADRPPLANRLPRHPLFDGEHRFPGDEAVARPVVQRMDVVVRRHLVDEHDAGPPEVEHALDLLNRALEDLAHVHRGVDQGRQLPDNRETSRRRAGGARLHGGAVFARGEVELPHGRCGGGPLLGQRHPALQPAARQVLEIARHARLVQIAAGGEQHDRHRSRRRVRLQPPAHFVPVHLRHHDVDQDHVQRRAAGELDAGGARAGRHYPPPGGELERPPHEPEEVGVIIDDQRAEGVGHRSWLRAGMSPILAGARENIGRMNPKVYILDDDLVHAKLVAANLGPGRMRTQVFDRSDALLARHAEEPADAVITDLVMPDLDGVEVTRRLRTADRHLPIFVLTGHADVATAIDVLKAGATEYLTKPVNVDELTTLLTRALAERPLLEEGASLEQARGQQFSVQAILGGHPKVEGVRGFGRRTAAMPRPSVLLLGESGTGKNLVARAIHYSSAHSAGRFVEINCSALPANLLEAELFGYKKGAFTDAREAKRGLIEVADGGTLFLDEIAELGSEVQAKLLNFLESRRFRRLGGTDEIEVGLRLITATNRELKEQVDAGKFRADLYYRITVAAVTLPPLREIKSDIPLLADHFRETFNREFKKRVESPDATALEALQAWPC